MVPLIGLDCNPPILNPKKALRYPNLRPGTDRSPKKYGAAVEVEQGPQFFWGCDPRSDAKGPPAALDRLQGQIPEKTFGAPLPLSGGPAGPVSHEAA
jgi:hypothetical protein